MKTVLRSSLKEDLIRQERTRAQNYVLRYESILRQQLKAKPNAGNRQHVEALIERLVSIRMSIMGSVEPLDPMKQDRRDGGFTLEDIEKAQAIIEGEGEGEGAQEENPFG